MAMAVMAAAPFLSRPDRSQGTLPASVQKHPSRHACRSQPISPNDAAAGATAGHILRRGTAARRPGAMPLWPLGFPSLRIHLGPMRTLCGYWLYAASLRRAHIVSYCSSLSSPRAYRRSTISDAVPAFSPARSRALLHRALKVKTAQMMIAQYPTIQIEPKPIHQPQLL